ncbi:MAG: ABC transporter permease [Chloroflexota bacterium]
MSTVPRSAGVPGNAPTAVSTSTGKDVAVTVIRPSRGWASVDFGALWEYRELLYFLVWRDLKVRYKQTVIGAAWAVIQPLFTMVVFSVVLGRLAGVPSDGLPYPLFSYAGLLPWQLFSHAFTESANSLVGSQSLITKVYFPRLVIPISAVMSAVVDFGVAFGVLVVMMIYYGVVPAPSALLLPLMVLLALGAALGVGLWLSALNVKYRDVRYVVPFLAQLWLFATPVAYPASLIPEPWRTVSAINPMAGVVEGFRWALLGGPDPSRLLIVSIAVVVALVASGLFYFRRMERVFADVV